MHWLDEMHADGLRVDSTITIRDQIQWENNGRDSALVKYISNHDENANGKSRHYLKLIHRWAKPAGVLNSYANSR